MIRLLISVALALAVATWQRPCRPRRFMSQNSMITKIPKPANPRAGIPYQVTTDGICMVVPATSPEPTRVYSWMKACVLR